MRVYAATGTDANTRGVSFRQANITGGDRQAGWLGAKASLSLITQYMRGSGRHGAGCGA